MQQGALDWFPRWVNFWHFSGRPLDEGRELQEIPEGGNSARNVE